MYKNNDKITLRPVAQKTLLLLLNGVALGLSGSPRQYFYILKSVKKDWEHINHRALHHAIKQLYKSKLIEAQDNNDGTTTLVLTQHGKKKALTYQINEIKIPQMKKWDGNWRIVIFDIPESQKRARDALAKILKNMNFHQLQKSVFVHPFECDNEINFVIEFFNVRRFVRLIVAHSIDNELDLKKRFKLL